MHMILTHGVQHRRRISETGEIKPSASLLTAAAEILYEKKMPSRMQQGREGFRKEKNNSMSTPSSKLVKSMTINLDSFEVFDRGNGRR